MTTDTMPSAARRDGPATVRAETPAEKGRIMPMDPARAARVVEKLNVVYRMLVPTIEQAHLQEHWLEATGWKGLSKLWDRIETRGHEELLHPLMKRTNAIGGRNTPAYGFEPAPPADATEIGGALAAMIGRLQDLHAALISACETAELVDDYCTQEAIWGFQGLVEKLARKCEKQARQIAAVGLQAFLAERR